MPIQVWKVWFVKRCHIRFDDRTKVVGFLFVEFYKRSNLFTVLSVCEDVNVVENVVHVIWFCFLSLAFEHQNKVNENLITNARTAHNGLTCEHRI